MRLLQRVYFCFFIAVKSLVVMLLIVLTGSVILNITIHDLFCDVIRINNDCLSYFCKHAIYNLRYNVVLQLINDCLSCYIIQ